MRPHQIFFWCVCFFLTGVLFMSAAGDFLASLFFIIALSLILYGFGRRLLALLALAAILGAGYYSAYGFFHSDRGIVFNQKVEFEGVVSEAEQRIESQKLVVENIQISLKRYPEYAYGDRIKVAGVIKEPPPEAAGYFKKEGIRGLMLAPSIEVLSTGNGSAVMAGLLRLRSFVDGTFKKIFPFDQAVFLSGLTLGSTAEFSDEFKEKLKLTGTSHLVALSGYNIAAIVWSIGILLRSLRIGRKIAFPISVLSVIGFVLMTGAEASVVRAAIMAGLVMLADRIGRIYHLRNAMAGAALVMIVLNPYLLAFDIGFQLSFVALIGIVYLEPLVKKWLRLGDEPGLLGWRKHLSATTAAQLAVLPVLIFHFGYFSPLGIISNLLILEFVPITMALGFATAFAAAIFQPLALIISLPTGAFLAYELGVIEICSKIIGYLI